MFLIFPHNVEYVGPIYKSPVNKLGKSTCVRNFEQITSQNNILWKNKTSCEVN